jgi:hypothetical protein
MKIHGRFGTFTPRPDQVDHYAKRAKAQKKKRDQSQAARAEWLDKYRSCLNGCGKPVAFYDEIHYSLKHSGCCSPECEAAHLGLPMPPAKAVKPVKLQVNTTGAWRDVVGFDAGNDLEACEAMDAAATLGRIAKASFRVVMKDSPVPRSPEVLVRWTPERAAWEEAARRS